MKRYTHIMSEAGAAEVAARLDGTIRSAVTRSVLRGAVMLVILIAGIVIYTLWEMRQDAWRRAEQNAQTVLRTVADSVEAHSRLIDFAMEMAVAALRESQSEEVTSGGVHRLIAAAAERAGQVSVMLVLDKDGNVIVDSDLDPPREVNLAARDYFKVHQENGAVGDFVSKPLFAVLDHGQPSIVVSRRMNDADGTFAGVLVVGIRLLMEAELLNSLGLGQLGHIMLVSRDGIIYLESQGTATGGVGADISAVPFFKRIQESLNGSFVETKDGARTLVTFTPVGRTNFILILCIAFSGIFAEWWHRAFIIGSVALVACGAIAIVTALLLRELRRRVAAEARLGELSMTDSLTGLSNRRHFDYMLEREWRRTARTKSNLALLFIDADHFKALNDDFGHMQGDEALRAIADCVMECIRRPGDFAARFGGEEFAVILPDTDEQAAWTIAERIRARVEQLEFGASSKVHVTVSIGVKALNPQPSLTIASLVEAADQALYRAKDTGRNRVVLAE